MLGFAHATETAPWPIQEARRALAARARDTGRRILSAEINEEGEVSGEVITEKGGPFSEHVSDAAVRDWNRLVDDPSRNPHFEVSRPPDDSDPDE